MEQLLNSEQFGTDNDLRNREAYDDYAHKC